MAIIVETGAVIASANSFCSLEFFQQHCEDRNRTLTSYTEPEQEAALISMGDYLNSKPWKGVKTGRDNPMAWPRYGDESGGNLWNQLEWPASAWVGVLDVDGFYIPTDEVPAEVINAQCEGAWLILQGKNLEPTLDRGGQIKRQKVDVIEVEYFGGASPQTKFTSIDNRLRGLLRSSATMEIVRA